MPTFQPPIALPLPVHLFICRWGLGLSVFRVQFRRLLLSIPQELHYSKFAEDQLYWKVLGYDYHWRKGEGPGIYIPISKILYVSPIRKSLLICKRHWRTASSLLKLQNLARRRLLQSHPKAITLSSCPSCSQEVRILDPFYFHNLN